MSHIVEIKTEIRDPVAIHAACQRLTLPEPVFGEVKLFSTSATGWAVQLPDWRYPVVCDVNTAKIAYDNYEGRWGDPRQLDLPRAHGRLRSLQIPRIRQGPVDPSVLPKELQGARHR